jgi:predicted nucleic acid-binding protein
MLRAERDLAAPDLADVETVSVLRRRWLNGDLTARRFRSAITDLGDLAIMRHPTLPFMPRAYELRANVTPHDATYIGLAEALNCELVTAATRLDAAPGPRCQIRIVRS